MKFRLIHFTLFFAAIAGGHATVVTSANFSGMAVTDQTTVSPVAGANGFTWTLINTSVNFDVVSDDGSPGIGSGNALRTDQSSTTGTFRGMLGTLPSTTTINIGDTITFSFSGRYYESPANNSGGFRFGLINPDDLDNNFYAQLGTGGNTGFGIFQDTGGDDSPGAGATTNLGATGSGETYTTLGLDPFAAAISITRNGASGYQIVANVNGAIRTATSTSGWDSYNAIFMRNGSTSADFLVDNVTVSLIPEPAVALLGAFGLITLLRRRR